MSEYIKELNKTITNISKSIIDFDIPRSEARMPTQASSEFITKKQQGDWAEELLFKAINDCQNDIVAVKYGKSDDIIAGDPDFHNFYEAYQRELDCLGKRPDLLIFKKSDFNKKLGFDISNYPHEEILSYVKKAVAGIEVRSSAFLIEKYELALRLQKERIKNKISNLIINLKDKISRLKINKIKNEFDKIIEAVSQQDLNLVSFRCPSYRSSDELVDICEDFKSLKKYIKEYQKRDFLSITPKVEDLKVVKNWIEKTGVPHFYVQVFFDKIYGISFIDILKLITHPEYEGTLFEIGADTKNQNKTTIKINTHETLCIAGKVDEPLHESKRKEMNRGRLLFYVTFEGGKAFLDSENLLKLLNID